MSRGRRRQPHSHAVGAPHELLWLLAWLGVRSTLGNDEMLSGTQGNLAEVGNGDLYAAFLPLLLSLIATMSSETKHLECYCTLVLYIADRLFRFFLQDVNGLLD